MDTEALTLTDVRGRLYTIDLIDSYNLVDAGIIKGYIYTLSDSVSLSDSYVKTFSVQLPPESLNLTAFVPGVHQDKSLIDALSWTTLINVQHFEAMPWLISAETTEAEVYEGDKVNEG